ncbi:hypothetical protein H6G27_35800 [Nostoc linckia FACHB-104]|nr:hypothetical protein [Nostoc linckia FACHB-104]
MHIPRRLPLADGNEANQAIQDTVHPGSVYELSEPIAEPLNQLTDKGYSDLNSSSPERFTPLNLSREQVGITVPKRENCTLRL